MSKQLVLMDHDGGVDDYLATMLLMTMDNVQPFSLKYKAKIPQFFILNTS